MDEQKIHALIAAITGAILGVLGHPVIAILLAITVIDFLTGVLRGAILHKIESSLFARGVWRLVSYLSVGTLFILIGKVDQSLLILSNILLSLFAMREAISCVENLATISKLLKVEIPGLQLAAKVLRLNLKKIEDQVNSKEEKVE